MPAVEKNEAGPSGQSRTDSRERAPIVLPTLPIFGQTTEAAAGEQHTIIEEVQDTVSFFYRPCALQLIARFLRR